MNNSSKNARIDYSTGVQNISDKAYEIASFFKEEKVSKNDGSKINDMIKTRVQDSSIKVLICDLEGNVLYSSDNVSEKKIDVYNTLRNVMDRDNRVHYENGKRVIIYENKEYDSLYPISFTDGYGYIVVKGVPYGNVVYDKYDNSLLAVLFAFAAFIISFYFITSRKMQYIENVSSGLLEISKGNLDFRIKRVGNDEIASLADNINNMAEKLKNKIEKERQIEKTKNELITNVSHDLRTPLTSIKGYLGLIKEKKYNDGTQLEEFVNIAYNKSEKLQSLINDLFEYTKVSSNGIALNKEIIDINELLQQLTDEMVPICEENEIIIENSFQKEKINVNIDGDKMVRVFENLLTNAIRYSIKPGVVKLSLFSEEENVFIKVENRCTGISKEDVERIFDRFYRAEKSRSRETGGSGLGLAIAKSIVELHGGNITAVYNEPTIIFTVKLIRS
ncbi:MAG: two component sensor histidine kinase [Clostridiaceae bacterium]|nr:two component sensor histidine kinase [Clostridiaceae bacterium]